MSTHQETKSVDLVAVYQRAHEELAELEARFPSPCDQSPYAVETRAAIERHRVMIRELRRALRASPR